MAGLGIQVLGGFRVWGAGHSVPEGAWRLRKAKSLVKLLALAPQHRLHREQVVELLWPDHELKAANHSLHQALYVARQAITPAGLDAHCGLQFQGDILHLSLREGVWIDFEAFLNAAENARQSFNPAAYEAALSLYTGELLPEDRFEEWAGERREQLRQEHLVLLIELAGLYEVQRKPELALETLRRALASDPAREDIHRRVMRLYGQSGQRQQALRQYALLRETLRRELDIEPDRQSQNLYQDLLADRLSPPSVAVDVLPAPAVEFPGKAVSAAMTGAEPPFTESSHTNGSRHGWMPAWKNSTENNSAWCTATANIGPVRRSILPSRCCRVARTSRYCAPTSSRCTSPGN